ncbi:7095_t:CDS:2 [Paraglomus occultum]|uniref:7095_t:CDS:1 n=1 Tax=Paraglomus occultum TaxID=144539 RepID=A0A9N8ZMD4_9GLOM|nr:7095_t:CDS:2 [Paraglomus occultum]
MGSPIIQSRRPEFVHKACPKCHSELEFPSATLPSSKIFVQCYSCQKICEFEVKGGGIPSSIPMSNNNKRRFGSDREPLETEYYDLLEVSVTADISEIKRQYYKLALKYHPDKNNSPDAEQRALLWEEIHASLFRELNRIFLQFKKISEAYQVLSDPELRRKYNEYGAKSNEIQPEGGFVNPEEFFKQQFGGDRFVDIIGEISIGRDMKEVLQNASMDETSNANSTDVDGRRRENNKNMQDEEREKIRQERVDKLVSKLIERLDYYVKPNNPQNAAHEFRRRMEKEADELKTESYGVELLHAIGFTYSLKAKQHLGGDHIFGLPRFGHIIREKGHVFSETISTLKSAIDLQQSFTQLQEAEKKGVNDAEKSRLEEAAANKGLETLWKGSKLEVESVLREVCDRVLSDPTVPKSIQRKRAEALKIVGSVYEHVRAEDN